MNSAFIELNEEDKLGDNNNYWYKKFIYLGKKFIMETKKKIADKSEYIIYYCHLHCTTIENEKINKDCNKLKTAKCYSRVYYYKNKKKYYMFADIEGEISNYNQFKTDLIEYLNSHPK